jgi:hypothetical protein
MLLNQTLGMGGLKTKCPVCDKRFINGRIRQSKVTECIACDRLTHERCAKSKHTVCKCVVCQSMEEEDEEELSEDDQGDDEDDYVHGDNDLRMILRRVRIQIWICLRICDRYTSSKQNTSNK